MSTYESIGAFVFALIAYICIASLVNWKKQYEAAKKRMREQQGDSNSVVVRRDWLADIMSKTKR